MPQAEDRYAGLLPYMTEGKPGTAEKEEKRV